MFRRPLVPGLLVLAACGGGDADGPSTLPPPPPPSGPVVTTIEVAPSAPAPIVGQTVQLTAVVKDQHGAVMTGKNPSWSTSAPSVATVSPAGLVTAAQAGQATITASTDGRSGSVVLTVRPLGAPVSAVIGATGGSLQSTMNGGATMQLGIPANALDAPSTIVIDTATPGAGIKFAFKVSSVILDAAKPITIRITAPQGTLTGQTGIVLGSGASRRILPGTVDGSGVLTAVIEPSTTALQAVRGLARASVEEPLAEGSIYEVTLAERIAIAQQLLDVMRVGSRDSTGELGVAAAVTQAMQSVALIPGAAANALVHPLVLDWRTIVCSSQLYALHVMQSFGAETDLAGLRRVGRNLLGWTAEAIDMFGVVSQLGLGIPACPDGTEQIALGAYKSKVEELLPRIRANMLAFDLPSRLNSLFSDRLLPLLDVGRDLELFGLIPSSVQVAAVVTELLSHLRTEGYKHCRELASQDAQSRLALHLSQRDPIAAAAAFTEGEIYSDVTHCGVWITWQRVSNVSGQVEGTSLFGGGNQIGPITLRRKIIVPSLTDGELRLKGPIQTLRCPVNASENNEKLQVTARRGELTPVLLQEISAPGSNRYLDGPELRTTFAALKSAVGMSGNHAATVVLTVARAGGVCSGMFGGMMHQPIAELEVEFTLSVPPLKIVSGGLPKGVAGTGYDQTLVAEGGDGPHTWSVASGSLPPGLSLSATGRVTGTPTTPGSYTFTVRVRSGDQEVTLVITLTIDPPPTQMFVYAGTRTVSIINDTRDAWLWVYSPSAGVVCFVLNQPTRTVIPGSTCTAGDYGSWRGTIDGLALTATSISTPTWTITGTISTGSVSFSGTRPGFGETHTFNGTRITP